MSEPTDYKRIDDVNTVTSCKSFRFDFQTLADRASELTHHHSERGGVVDDEGMIPHN